MLDLVRVKFGVKVMVGLVDKVRIGLHTPSHAKL